MRWTGWLLTVGLCCTVSLLWMQCGAQTAPPNSGSRIAPRNSDAPASGQSSSLVTINDLGGDARLTALVSLSSTMAPMKEIVRKLRALTNLPLEINGRQAQDYCLAFYFKDARLGDVLDSLAAVRDFSWAKQPPGRIVLFEPYNPRLWDVWPNNLAPEEQLVYGLGRQFMLLYQQLPDAVQFDLCDARQGRGVASFYAIPLPMQETVRAMLRLTARVTDKRLAVSRDPRLKGAHTRQPEYGPETRVILYKNYQEPLTEGVPGYGVSVIGQGGTTGNAAFFDFTEEVITPSSPPILLDHTKEDMSSREEAVSKDARLKTKYTLEGKSLDFAEALLKLSALTRLNFAAEFWNRHWEMQNDAQPHTFSFQEMTLTDILDHLASEYHASWSWRPSGIIVWHPAFKLYPRH